MPDTRSTTTRAAAPGGAAAGGPRPGLALLVLPADHATRTIWARFDWPEQPQPDPRPGQDAVDIPERGTKDDP